MSHRASSRTEFACIATVEFPRLVIISPKNTGLARNAEIIDNPRLIVSKQIT
jgi:hypothetical protein